MARGIEGRKIFRAAADYDDFLARVAALATAGRWAISAWALLPNHFHLLVRTGSRPLARNMRSLLTGYAGVFNRRHNRRGHLFQNRYKSIVIEEEPYFLELVRYLHLNPLRAGVVESLAALDRYHYTGHAALLGNVARPWQDTATVLAWFAVGPSVARRRYRDFMAAGVAQGPRPELQGGGLVRSVGGWEAVKTLRRGREAYIADERVLGTGAFVEQLLREVEGIAHSRATRRSRQLDLETLVHRIGTALHVQPAMILGRSQAQEASRARHVLAYVWVECLGRRASELALVLGRSPSNIVWAAKRGGEFARAWRQKIQSWCRI